MLKFGKKLGNQVLGALKDFRGEGMYWDDIHYVLVDPAGNLKDESDNRPYIREVRPIYILLFLRYIFSSD